MIIVLFIKGCIRLHFKRLLFITVIVFFGIGLQHVFSAPEPTEVEEIKLKAPVHLKAVVLEDELFKDLSKEKGTYYQIRKMRIGVKKFIKNTTNESNEIDIYYSYIPSWQENQWDGGKRVGIAVNDEIEIWLKKGEYGLEPALGGYTVKHLKYADEREEPIKEPLTHVFNRKLHEAWSNYSGLIVFIILLSSLVIIILFSLVKKKINL